MSSFLSKIRIKKATPKKQKFDLTHDNLTTLDFYQLKPVLCRELVPGEDISIQLSTFTRLAPLVKPLFASCQIQSRGHVVKFSQLYYDFDKWLSQGESWSSGIRPTYLPYTTIGTIFTSFLTVTAYTEEVTDSEEIAKKQYDIALSTNSANTTFKYFLLRPAGKRVYDTLLNLGYAFNASDYSDRATKVSIMPLLAYYKVYRDWYDNPQYQIFEDCISMVNDHMRSVNCNNPISSNLVENIINEGIGNLFCDDDVFTAAWDNPVSPNEDFYSDPINLVDPTASLHYSSTTLGDVDLTAKVTTEDWKTKSSTATTASTYYSDLGGTPVVTNIYNSGLTKTSGSYNSNLFTQYIDTALHKATDFIMRNKLSGTRAIDRLRARFGVTPNMEQLRRSQYLGMDVCNIEISDIMNTTDLGDDSAPLGSYAGRGIGFSQNGHFNYSTDDFAFLIITSVVRPHISNGAYGRDKMVQHLGVYDMYTNEFDGLGTEPIRQDELYCDNIRKYTYTGAYKPDGIFGWTGRYHEYKVANDKLTGDFRFYTAGASNDLGSFHMYRDLVHSNGKIDEILHSHDFTQLSKTNFNRVWSDLPITEDGTANNNYVDHFFTLFHFDIKSYKNMKPLMETYEWSECDAPNQTINLNGTQLK